MNGFEMLEHSNGRGSPPIGAYGCGCDEIDPHIHEWVMVDTVVRASYCAKCGRVISFQIMSNSSISNRDITPEFPR